jgi:hypothetical protein
LGPNIRQSGALSNPCIILKRFIFLGNLDGVGVREFRMQVLDTSVVERFLGSVQIVYRWVCCEIVVSALVKEITTIDV